jgi:hypothetical protein
MPTKYYVVASRGNDAYVLPLLGPFDRASAALMMWDAVHDATRRVRPDLADCMIKPKGINAARGKHPRGRLDLTVAVDDAWRAACLNGGKL